MWRHPGVSLSLLFLFSDQFKTANIRKDWRRRQVNQFQSIFLWGCRLRNFSGITCSCTLDTRTWHSTKLINAILMPEHLWPPFNKPHVELTVNYTRFIWNYLAIRVILSHIFCLMTSFTMVDEMLHFESQKSGMTNWGMFQFRVLIVQYMATALDKTWPLILGGGRVTRYSEYYRKPVNITQSIVAIFIFILSITLHERHGVWNQLQPGWLCNSFLGLTTNEYQSLALPPRRLSVDSPHKGSAMWKVLPYAFLMSKTVVKPYGKPHLVSLIF